MNKQQRDNRYAKVFFKNIFEHSASKIISRGLLQGISMAVGFLTCTLLAVSVTGTFNTFSSGNLLKSADINANFATLKTAIETVEPSPSGTIVAFGGTTPPAGWLLCNGQTVSRSTYSSLYAVVGNSFGSGDGSTTFHLPDLRGRFLRGLDGTAGNDPDSGSSSNSGADGKRYAVNGGNTGNLIGSVQASDLKNHIHNVYIDWDGNSTSTYNQYLAGSDWHGIGSPRNSNLPFLSTGGNPGSETRPVNVYVNFIIKY